MFVREIFYSKHSKFQITVFSYAYICNTLSAFTALARVYENFKKKTNKQKYQMEIYAEYLLEG